MAKLVIPAETTAAVSMAAIDMERTLTQLPFWSSLTKHEMETLRRSAFVRHYEKGAFVHSSDTECLGMLFVLSGEIRTYLLSEEGREVTLFRLYPGELLSLIHILSMAAMLTAAVVTAGVTSFAVLVVMVITVNIGIVAQISAEQCAHRRVSVPADTAIELDTRLGQSCLRTAADASADQSVHAVLHQEACQCAVAAAVGINDFRMSDFAVHSFIKLEPVSYTHLDVYKRQVRVSVQA